MWTGRQTLSSLEQAIARLNAEESQLDTALRQAAGELERLRRERSDGLRELARVKLDEMESGRLIRALDAGERRALQILAERRDRLAALGEQRSLAVSEVEVAEAARHDAAAAVEERLEEVTALRAEVEARIHATAEWKAAKAVLDSRGAVAGEAEKKATQSEQELAEKKKPYDNDPLFLYLWHRGFGTGSYRAGNIARMLDRRVSDFIGFLDVRPNYVMLTEIPLRLREHAREKRRIADEQQSVVGEIERRAMLAAGVEAKERLLAQARHRLAAADTAAEQKRVRLKALDDERATLIEGGEAQAREAAIEAIAGADAMDPISVLLSEARRTPTDADEAIVRRLEELVPRTAEAEKEAGDLRRSAKQLADRRLEVERARDQFRGSGYDHPDVEFGNDSAIADVLEQVVRGVVRSGILWDLLRAGYRTRGRRADPDFGFPNLPFPFPLPGRGSGPRGGGWREPTSRGGWEPGGSWGGGSGGGSSSGNSGGGKDGFTTGGSF